MKVSFKHTFVMALLLSLSLVNSIELTIQQPTNESPNPSIVDAKVFLVAPPSNLPRRQYGPTNSFPIEPETEKYIPEPQKEKPIPKPEPPRPTPEPVIDISQFEQKLTEKKRQPEIFKNGCEDFHIYGSPILLVSQIREHIQENLKFNNHNTFVHYIYFSKVDGLTPFSALFTMIWEIKTSFSVEYVGITLDNPTFGIGSVKFTRFIYNSKLSVIYKVLKIDQPKTNPVGLVCGDQKFIFSSYGNDPRRKLPDDYPGLNENSIPPFVLKSLQELQKSSQSITPPQRDCDQSRFINSSNIYFRIPMANAAPVITLPNNKDDPTQYQNYFELSRCDPHGEPIVESIELYCQFNCCPATNGALLGARATFKIPFQTTKVEVTPVAGTSPSSATKLTVPLYGVTRIESYYPANGSYFALRTFDKESKIMGSYYCGNNAPGAVSQNGVPQDSILVKDLLGVFGGWKTDAAIPNPQFSYFGFVRYV
jgi:hypothetical protein